MPESPTVGNAVCVGEIFAEWIFHSPEELPANRTVIAENLQKELGGAAFNVFWYLVQLGRTSCLVAPAGQADKEAARAALAPHRIETSDFLPIPVDCDTDTLFTVVGNESHRSVYAMSRWPPDTRELLLEKCAGAKSLILNGGRHPEIRDCYKVLAESAGAPFFAFNPSYAIFEYSRDELAAIFGKAQVTVLNAQEFDFLESCVGEVKPKRLGNDPPQIVAVTRGQEGVRVLSAEKSFELPSFTFKDGIAIGAGDAFFAGFLHHFLEGANVRDSARYGLALAAIVVDSNQIRTAISENEIRQHLA